MSLGERMSYGQSARPQGQAFAQSTVIQSNKKRFDLLAPFRSRSRQNEIYIRLENPGMTPDGTNQTHRNFQNKSQVDVSQSASASAAQDQARTLTLRANDPPEVIEFALAINDIEIYTYEQKEEMLTLLRGETPEMRRAMIANFMAGLPKEQRHAIAGSYHTDAPASPIVQASHVSAINTVDMARVAGIYDSSQIQQAAYADEATSPNSFRMSAENEKSSTSLRFGGRLPSELSAPPRIIADQALPSVAAPIDHVNAATSRTETQDYQTNANSHIAATGLSQSERNTTNTPFEDEYSADSFYDTRGENHPEYRFSQTPEQTAGSRMRIAVSDDPINEIQHLEIDHNIDDEMLTDSQEGAYSSMSRPFSQVAPRDDLRMTPRIVADNFATHEQENWSETVNRALESLNRQLETSATWEERENLQAEINQRLIHLLLGNQREAIRPIPGLSPALQDFWKNELLGLSTILDEVSIPNPSHRFAVAQHHLQAANLHLQDLCPIRIRNMNFINQCDGFGVYEVSASEFHRGEPVFVYAEIDNLICRELDNDDYITQVSSSYEVVDVLGNTVTTGDFSKTRKITQSRIRDAFLLWRVDLPENIVPGKYFLKISVSDLNHPNHQLDQQSLEFNVLPPVRNN